MLRAGLVFSFALFFLFAFSPPVFAQPGPKSFDQYPSFIELTSIAPDETRVVLRCGYAAPGGKTEPDSGFEEISMLNDPRKTYARFQHIDNYIIATYAGPAQTQSLLLELLRPDGSVTAKLCQTDLNTDAIGNCRPAMPSIPVAQIHAEARKVAEQCRALFAQNGAQVNPARASPEKTESFKARLREKIRVLETP